VAAAAAEVALDALLRWHIGFALSQPDLITVQTRELANVPEPARRRIRRLQRLYVEEWATVLSELLRHTPQARLRTAVHAMSGLLNSTPHSASELPPDPMTGLLHAMARAALAATDKPSAQEVPASRAWARSCRRLLHRPQMRGEASRTAGQGRQSARRQSRRILPGSPARDE
jgi:hypothetical protein